MTISLFIISFLLVLNLSLWITKRLKTNSSYEGNLIYLMSSYLIVAFSILITGFFSILTPIGVTGLLLTVNVAAFLYGYLEREPFANYADDRLIFKTDKFHLLGLSIVLFYFINATFGTVWISLDDSTYHAAMPALWVKNGSFFVNGYTYQQTFPLNGSLFSTFFLLFFRNEYNANISEVLLLLISYFSVANIVKNKNKDNFMFLLFFLYFSSLDVQKYMAGFSDSDIMPGVFFLGVLSLMSNEKRKDVVIYFCSLILGFLIGVKLTNLFFMLPFAFLVMNPIAREQRKLLISVCLFLTGLAPWYGKNLFLLGNPIYPFAKFGFEGMFTSELTSLSSIKGIWSELGSESKISYLLGFFGWQKFSWSVSLVLIYFGIKKVSLEKNDKREMVLTCLCALSFCVFTFFYIGAPFSGYNESLKLNISSSRYFLSLILPVLFLVCWKMEFNKFSKIYRNFLMIIIFFLAIFPRFVDKKFIVSIGLTLVFYYLSTKLIKKEYFKIRASIIFLIILSVTYFYSGPKAESSKDNVFWYKKVLDKHAVPKKISIFDGFIFRSYYLFGKNLINNPVRLDFFGRDTADGVEHNSIENYIYLDRIPQITANYCSNFIKNILETNIDILILSKGPGGEYPPQMCSGLSEYFKAESFGQKGIVYTRI